MIGIPPAVSAMAGRGPLWAAWVDSLPATLDRAMQQWGIRPDGRPAHGHCSLVVPVRTAEGAAAVLKVGFPDEESEHEHLALRRWGGVGAVRLLSAEPYHRVLLLERLDPTDLTGLPEDRACAVVADLYRLLHVAPLPALRALRSFVERWTADLAALPRGAPIPRRLVEQAVALGRDLGSEDSAGDRVLHTDLHYGNVLAGAVGWLAIDPKPVNGDPHYEIAPMLWNRRPPDRDGIRRRFWMLVDAAGFDEQRARAWVVVRMVHNAMWAVQDAPRTEPSWLTTCIAVAKAVQD